MKTDLKIISAKYISGYKIEITFSDGKVNIFDYENLVNKDNEEYLPYRNIKAFKKFSVVKGNSIAWGDDWHMILSLETLYNKNKVSNSGRKKVSDKKVLIRLYVNQSIIDENGGIEVCQEKCLKTLID